MVPRENQRPRRPLVREPIAVTFHQRRLRVRPRGIQTKLTLESVFSFNNEETSFFPMNAVNVDQPLLKGSKKVFFFIRDRFRNYRTPLLIGCRSWSDQSALALVSEGVCRLSSMYLPPISEPSLDLFKK